jgi:hypothetical protein
MVAEQQSVEPFMYKQPCRDAAEDRQSDLCAQWKAVDWAKTGTLIGIVSAVGIVIALLLTVDSNMIARRSVRRELRAYITFVEIHHSMEKDVMSLQIEWINRGKTPARSAASQADWRALDGPLPDDFDFPQAAPGEEDGPLTVGPGQNFFTGGIDPMPHELIVDAAAGKKRVYLWGTVNYTDVFGEPRRTEMAAKLVVTHVEGTLFDIRMDAIGRHNDIDSHCEKKPEGHLRLSLWRRLADAIRA